MSTTVINIKTDAIVKTKARAIAEELGLSLSAVINALLKQFVRTKKLNISARPEIPSPYLIKALKESEEDVKKGRMYSFNNAKGAIQFLHDNAVKYGKKHKKN